jgi:hypothetical protein
VVKIEVVTTVEVASAKQEGMMGIKNKKSGRTSLDQLKDRIAQWY